MHSQAKIEIPSRPMRLTPRSTLAAGADPTSPCLGPLDATRAVRCDQLEQQCASARLRRPTSTIIVCAEGAEPSMIPRRAHLERQPMTWRQQQHWSSLRLHAGAGVQAVTQRGISVNMPFVRSLLLQGAARYLITSLHAPAPSSPRAVSGAPYPALGGLTRGAPWPLPPTLRMTVSCQHGVDGASSTRTWSTHKRVSTRCNEHTPCRSYHSAPAAHHEHEKHSAREALQDPGSQPRTYRYP